MSVQVVFYLLRKLLVMHADNTPRTSSVLSHENLPRAVGSLAMRQE